MVDKTSVNKIAEHPLQTWEWGEFRENWGNKIVREDFGQVVFSRIPKTKFTIGTFIKGPKPTEDTLKELRVLGKEENAIFIKLEPYFVPQNQLSKNRLIKFLQDSGCVPGKTLFTPTTFWIDLNRSEEDILKSFSSKTRYNIRLAQKRGVRIFEDNSDKAFEKYLELTKETVKRQNFFAHTKKYHLLMWKYLHKDLIAKGEKPIARLLTAVYNKEIITCWIIFVWKDFLYYPYGASSDKYKNVMANNLMMWEAIRYGKALKLSTFDLWGREPGKGFTKFKEGYNPKIVEFLGTWDLIIYPVFYRLYKIAENIRWYLLKIPAKLGIIKPKF